jgi:hypothetical protein
MCSQFLPAQATIEATMNFYAQKLVCCLALLFVFCSSTVLSAQMNGEAARDWPVIFRDTLQHSVLQFWIDHPIDKEYGGLLGRLNRKGEPIDSGDKSVVLISRSLWSFSQAHRRRSRLSENGRRVSEISARKDVGQRARRLLLHGQPEGRHHR